GCLGDTLPCLGRRLLRLLSAARSLRLRRRHTGKNDKCKHGRATSENMHPPLPGRGSFVAGLRRGTPAGNREGAQEKMHDVARQDCNPTETPALGLLGERVVSEHRWPLLRLTRAP